MHLDELYRLVPHLILLEAYLDKRGSFHLIRQIFQPFPNLEPCNLVNLASKCSKVFHIQKKVLLIFFSLF